MYSEFTVRGVFAKILRGEYHVSSELDEGEIPLISCSAIDNGTEGFFDIPKEKRYKDAVTIASDGKPLATFYHRYEFAAKDNVIVCIPPRGMYEETIYHIVAQINAQQWRFNYGRKCYLNKLEKIKIFLPVTKDGKIDQDKIRNEIKLGIKEIMPKRNEQGKVEKLPSFRNTVVSELFDLLRGDFHAIDALDEGKFPTVSRVASDNGIVGYFDKPDDARVFPAGCITVSTVSGDAFVQLSDFIATDNVVICIPKSKMKIHSLIFIQSMINKVKWRYSYGRQCYKKVFARTEIPLPINADGKLDEAFMEKTVTAAPYWKALSSMIKA